jgi:lipopolysaccharide/colanic/teichoic acid biosynthesis glycosyltransferase
LEVDETVTTLRKLALAAKRGMDVAGAATGLVVLSPVLAGSALAVAVAHGRPVLFRQTRPGLGGKPFTICKFRTMRSPKPGEVSYLTDAQRVTRLGRLLRDTSLDELPELWNVLKGEMSLVGPRPLLMEYLDKYTPEEARRHEMPPGITGWAAVNGRHALKFRERLKLDTWYVCNWSLWLDLKILAMTVYQVLRRSDVATTQGVEEMGFPLPIPGRPQPPEGEASQVNGRPGEGGER